jgi:hypothetical protein
MSTIIGKTPTVPRRKVPGNAITLRPFPTEQSNNKTRPAAEPPSAATTSAPSMVPALSGPPASDRFPTQRTSYAGIEEDVFMDVDHVLPVGRAAAGR